MTELNRFDRSNFWLPCARRLAVILAVTALLLASTGVAQAANITVTTLADSGAGSLRQAMLSANSGDTIVFNIPGGGTINLLSAPADCRPNWRADHRREQWRPGCNHHRRRLDVRRHGDRVLFLGVKGSDNTGATATDAAVWTISNLTIRNGNARGGDGGSGGITGDRYSGGGAGAGMGGGIFLNAGTLNLNNVAFVDNRATGGRGGSATSGPLGASGGGGGMGGNGGSPGGYNSGGGGGFGLGANGGGTSTAGAAGQF